jgi:septum formation protein
VTRGPHLVLASASPRRRELLARLELDFEVRPTGTDETPHPGEAPEAHVLRLAAAKANAAALPGEMVLGADTIVVVDGEILGKPGDDEEARAMLRRLSGRDHEVWTGVALAVRAEGAEPELHSRSCRTLVRFRALTDADIDAYVATGEPADKAGAYGIQGGAAAFVESIEGDYDNVVGLPLATVRDLLRLAPAPRPA